MRKFLISLFLLIVILFSFSFTFTKSVSAGPTGTGYPFGGYVVDFFPCTCSGNFWLYLAPFFAPALIPSGGPIVYQPGFSFLYAEYALPAIGVWLLGDYIPGVQACYMYVGVSCVPIPSSGVINSTGTSLPTSL